MLLDPSKALLLLQLNLLWWLLTDRTSSFSEEKSSWSSSSVLLWLSKCLRASGFSCMDWACASQCWTTGALEAGSVFCSSIARGGGVISVVEVEWVLSTITGVSAAGVAGDSTGASTGA